MQGPHCTSVHVFYACAPAAPNPADQEILKPGFCDDAALGTHQKSSTWGQTPAI